MNDRKKEKKKKSTVDFSEQFACNRKGENKALFCNTMVINSSI